jgi:serine/threonine-protein kinase HipA
MTPLYDVLTAQPSLDANQIRRNKFKLAMSVGKSRHYAVAEIMPRHFMQTAGDAGVANSLVQAILDDLAARALKTIDAVIETLPAGFPGPVTDSVRRGVSQRLRRLDAGTAAEDSHAFICSCALP